MLQLVIHTTDELWDADKNEFVPAEEQILQLEHSLVSLSKWESKWNKPFISHKDKTNEETLDYIRCMTLNENVDETVYQRITQLQIDQINEYIKAPMTATTFSREQSGRPSREQITAELVYYWMISAQIPFECQHWHLNRLLTLIRVCGVKNQPPKKMSKAAIARRNRDLNAARRQQFNTNG